MFSDVEETFMKISKIVFLLEIFLIFVENFRRRIKQISQKQTTGYPNLTEKYFRKCPYLFQQRFNIYQKFSEKIIV